jgi:Translation elongation factor P (EF-P)/translation initiation factor 5A (eIF-5A)
MYHFMHNETYEQVALEQAKVEKHEYLTDGEQCELVVDVDNERILYAEPPAQISTTVVETDPGLRGDTAQGGTKPAVIASGATVTVPLFINVGDSIRVDTRTGDYIERVKS